MASEIHGEGQNTINPTPNLTSKIGRKMERKRGGGVLKIGSKRIGVSASQKDVEGKIEGFGSLSCRRRAETNANALKI